MSTSATSMAPEPVPGSDVDDDGGSQPTPAQRRAFTRPELAFLIGVPLAWAVLLLFHPTGDGEAITYANVQDQVTPWLVVHLGMMFFIPLIAVAFFLLLRGVEGTAANVSRIALVPFVVFYGAYEVLLGVGTGILVHDVNGFAASERASGAALINEFTDNILIRGFSVLSTIGTVALITAVLAAGVALRRHAAAPLSVPILLGLSGFLMIGVPLAWAVLLWFHPSTDPDDIYGSLRDQVVTYQIVHVGTLIFIGLMGVALYMLVRDLPGKAATISRLAIGPFVLLYGAWESVIGLATGALVQHANDAPAGERAAVSDAIQSLQGNVIVGESSVAGFGGALAWVIAVIAAAVAIRRAGAPVLATVLLVLSVVVFSHPPPTASPGSDQPGA